MSRNAWISFGIMLAIMYGIPFIIWVIIKIIGLKTILGLP